MNPKENPADMLTKGLKHALLSDHIRFVNGYATAARASSALSINTIGLCDRWELRDGQMWVRTHYKQRHCIFTPLKVAGGPKTATQLNEVRLTIGKYNNGEDLVTQDNWKVSAEPHRRLGQELTGYTIFIAGSHDARI